MRKASRAAASKLLLSDIATVYKHSMPRATSAVPSVARAGRTGTTLAVLGGGLLFLRNSRFVQPKLPLGTQVTLAPHKRDVRLEERMVAFPSKLAAEIECNEAFFIHKSDNVGE